MDLAAVSAAGLPAQTAGLLTVALVTLAAWQRIDDWLAPKGFVKLVIPGKQGSSDDSDTAQNATMMFYERFPQHAPADNTARQISFKSTNSHLIVYIAVTHFDKMPARSFCRLGLCVLQVLKALLSTSSPCSTSPRTRRWWRCSAGIEPTGRWGGLVKSRCVSRPFFG